MARKPKPSGRKRPEQGAPMQKRAIRTRELRPRFLIVCEGEKTEPNYFQSFRVHADVKVVGTGRSPKAIVEHAQTLRREQDYSQVWVVFDRDSFLAEEFNAAIEQAHRLGIGAAYSNQAFELWYLLHFAFHDTALCRQQYQEILTSRLDFSYRKNDRDMYQRLQTNQAQVIRNAQKLLEQYQPHRPADDAPCTTVHLLVQELNRWLI